MTRTSILILLALMSMPVLGAGGAVGGFVVMEQRAEQHARYRPANYITPELKQAKVEVPALPFVSVDHPSLLARVLAVPILGGGYSGGGVPDPFTPGDGTWNVTGAISADAATGSDLTLAGGQTNVRPLTITSWGAGTAGLCVYNNLCFDDTGSDITLRSVNLSGLTFGADNKAVENHDIIWEFVQNNQDATDISMAVRGQASQTGDLFQLRQSDDTVVFGVSPTGVSFAAGDGGPSPPATCTPFTLFIDTDETDDTVIATTNDNALLGCVATDTWVVLEDT